MSAWRVPFVATAETGSMTAAAHLLNLTQGAISQQVKRLEELFGKQLFDRDHRTLSLTATGDRFLLHARRLISMNDEIWGLMSAPEFEGTVRLGVPRDIIRPFIPLILRSFWRCVAKSKSRACLQIDANIARGAQKR